MIDTHADVLDSRDIIDRLEEVTNELDEIEEYCDDNDIRYDEHDDYNSIHDEFRELEEVRAECQHIGDWEHGTTLINERYFTDYIKEMVEDCYEVPDHMMTGEWPWSHMEMDWDSAAEEAKMDYSSVDIAGTTFYVRD